MKKWTKGGRRLMAGLLTGTLLMGLSGCQKEPEPVTEPEPVDGEGTNRTDYNAPKEIQSKADDVVSDLQKKGDEIKEKLQNLLNQQKTAEEK